VYRCKRSRLPEGAAADAPQGLTAPADATPYTGAPTAAGPQHPQSPNSNSPAAPNQQTQKANSKLLRRDYTQRTRLFRAQVAGLFLLERAAHEGGDIAIMLEADALSFWRE
jgi:hypothetical protein